MKKFTVAVLATAFVILFTVFASVIKYRDVSDYDLVSGIAVDYDSGRWVVTCEICTPSSNNDFGSKAEYITADGKTLADAFKMADRKSNNILYTNSVQLYLVSDSVSDDYRLKNYLSTYGNLRAVAVPTIGKASDVLNSEKDSGGRAKSLTLANKLSSLCVDNGQPVPHVMNYIKNNCPIYISEKGILKIRSEE